MGMMGLMLRDIEDNDDNTVESRHLELGKKFQVRDSEVQL